jgi:hypothetical protein
MERISPTPGLLHKVALKSHLDKRRHKTFNPTTHSGVTPPLHRHTIHHRAISANKQDCLYSNSANHNSTAMANRVYEERINENDSRDPSEGYEHNYLNLSVHNNNNGINTIIQNGNQSQSQSHRVASLESKKRTSVSPENFRRLFNKPKS